MNQVNRIIIRKVDFPNDFWNRVSTQIQLLVETNHVIRVFFDKPAQELLLDYEPIDPAQNLAFPYFLYPQELLAAAAVHKESIKKELEEVINEDDDIITTELVKKDKKNSA